MNRELLDRASEDLAARVGVDVDIEAEVAELRNSGYSVVESAYIAAKAFGVSLAEAKRAAIVVESKRGKSEEIDAFYGRLADN